MWGDKLNLKTTCGSGQQKGRVWEAKKRCVRPGHEVAPPARGDPPLGPGPAEGGIYTVDIDILAGSSCGPTAVVCRSGFPLIDNRAFDITAFVNEVC